MTQAMETDQGIIVPESVLARPEGTNKCGSVPDLPDEELAAPEELERQVLKAEWGPILALPKPEQGCGIRPAVDESGGVDWGAFGTVDFERYSGGFDKARYKAEKLRETLKDKLILLAILKERLPALHVFSLARLACASARGWAVERLTTRKHVQTELRRCAGPASLVLSRDEKHGDGSRVSWLSVRAAGPSDGVWHPDALAPMLNHTRADGSLAAWGEKPFNGDCDGGAWDGAQLWALSKKTRRICVMEKA